MANSASGAPYFGWRRKYFGSNGADDLTDDLAIFFNHIVFSSVRYGIGIGGVLRYVPQSQPAANQALGSCADLWMIFGANPQSPATITLDEIDGISIKASKYAENGKTVTVTVGRSIKVTSPTPILVGSGVVNVAEWSGIDILDQSTMGATSWQAIRLASNNFIKARNAANTTNLSLLGLDASDFVQVGVSTVPMFLNGLTSVFSGSVQFPVVQAMSATSGTVSASARRVNITPSGAFTITLPTASSYTGREIILRNLAAFTVVSATSNVVPQAGGAAGTAILAATAGKYATLVSDGANWIIYEAN